MRTKAAFVVGGAIGYVLGTRAGRQQFERIRSSAQTLWENPKVQEAVAGVEEKAGGFVREMGPELKDKVSGVVRSATGRDSGPEDPWSTANAGVNGGLDSPTSGEDRGSGI